MDDSDSIGNDFDDDDISNSMKIQFQVNKGMRIPKRIGSWVLYKILRETKNSAVFALMDSDYAMKCIPFASFEKNNDELKFMTDISHPHLLNAVWSNNYPCSEPRFRAIVMPRARKDLLDYLVEYKYFSEPQVCKMMVDVLSGLGYLHANGICHRDIKLENLFLMKETSEGPYVSIGDFGLAHKYGNGFFTARALGTITYAAPELLEIDEEDKHFGLKFKYMARYCNNVDVFPLGVCMYFLLYGRHPFGKMDCYYTQYHLNGHVDFYHPNIAISELAQDLITKMLSPDPLDRPSIIDVINHPWFNQFDIRKPTISSVCIRYTKEANIIIGSETGL